MKTLYKLLALATFCLFLLTGCGSEKTADKPIIIGQTFVVSSIEPTKGGTPWSLTTHGLSETIFSLNDKGELVSRYVETVTHVSENEWKLTLKEVAKFSDGSPVDADAIVWSLNTIMAENPLSHATAGKLQATKTGAKEVTLITERPTQNIKALLAEWTNIIFKKSGDTYIFSGPYVLQKLDPNVELQLAPNPYYEEANRRGPVIVKAFKDAATLKLAFQAKEVDMAFGLTPEMTAELQSKGAIIQPIDAGYQYFGIVNLQQPLMADRTIREALDLGLNREDYLKALHGGRVATGLFAHYFPFAGDTKITYNLDKAKSLLDNDGWKVGSDGIREKNGQKLTLQLVTYNSRPDLKIILQVMTSQLKDLGFDVKTNIVDNIDAFAKTNQYDVLLYAQHTAPTGDPSYYLNQFYRSNGPKNMSHYQSSAVDNLLNQMGKTPYGDSSIALAKEVQSYLHKDLPVLFLVDPTWNIALSERLKDYKIYSGDYYLVNAHLFVK